MKTNLQRALKLTRTFVENWAESRYVTDRDLRLTTTAVEEFPRFIHSDIYPIIRGAFSNKVYLEIIDECLAASKQFGNDWVKKNIARVKALPPVDYHMRVKVGAILVHSIGCGCDSYYQITQRTPQSVKAVKLEEKYISQSKESQSGETVPIPNKINTTNPETVTLRLHPDGQIGPSKRMIWWSLWDGKPKDQFSP